MITITIPKHLIKEKDLMLIPRLQYEKLLMLSKKIIDQEKHLWQGVAQKNLLKSYGKADAIYDSI